MCQHFVHCSFREGKKQNLIMILFIDMFLTQCIYREIQQTYQHINCLSVVAFNIPREQRVNDEEHTARRQQGCLLSAPELNSHLRRKKTKLMWFCLDMKSTQRQMRWPSCWSRPRDWSRKADQTGRNLPDWRRFLLRSCHPYFKGGNKSRTPASAKKMWCTCSSQWLFNAFALYP